MLISKSEYPQLPIKVAFTESEIVVTLASGQIVRNPLSWHPWLIQATPAERDRYELNTFSIDWPDIDQGLDIEGMIRGIPSDPEQRRAMEKIGAVIGDPQKRELLLSFLDLLNRSPA